MAKRKLIGGALADINDAELEGAGMDDAAPDLAPLGGTRAEATQRLQAGLLGICTMVLLVGLASIIGTQAELAEQAAVPDAAPTTEPTEAPAQVDPLADAGIVPDIPAEPEEVANPDPAGSQDGTLDVDLDGQLEGTVPDTPSPDPVDAP